MSANHRLSVRLAAVELPRSVAPRWMTWTWIVAVVLVVFGTAAVLFGPMDERVSSPGVVRPTDYTLVFPASGGLVAEVPAAPGSPVRRGDLLLRLDSRDLERDRDTLMHEIAGAEARLADAQAQAVQAVPQDLAMQAAETPRLRAMVEERRKLLERMEASGDGRGLSLVELVRERLAFQSLERELERAERIAGVLAGPWAQAARDAAAARVRAAEATLAGLRGRLDHVLADLAQREIRAPDDGILVNRSVRFTGEQVELGKALFKIARGGGTRLRLYAGEDRVDRIRPGMRVLFRPRSDPDRLRPPRTGTVTEVALDRDLGDDAGSRPTDGTWAIDVAVDDGHGDLPLGASVEAEIVLGQRRFVHLLMTRR